MATRQYVGARYTIKIHTNSLDPTSAEWEANTIYENLVLVTYQNNSYISRKPVPANIGAPNVNGAYWALTGYYNGTIASIEARLDTIEDTLDRLLGNHYLIIGDSYATIGTPTWPIILKNIMGWDSSKVEVRAAAGYGFYRDGTHTWQNYLIANPVADNNAITDIIIAGGANDAGVAGSTLGNAIISFNTYIKSIYPNLQRVYLAFVGWTFEFNQSPNYKNAEIEYLNSALNLGWHYLNNVKYALHRPTYLESSGQRNHPTAAAAGYVGVKIAGALKNGIGTCEEQFRFTLTPDGSNFTGNAYNVNVNMYNDITELVIPDMTVVAAVQVRTGQSAVIFNVNTGENFLTNPVYIPFTATHIGASGFVSGLLYASSENEITIAVREGQIDIGDTILINANSLNAKPTMTW